MAIAWFRFYEELNDFLPAARRKVTFAHEFGERASVKDMIEALGVPHPEVDLILVDGVSVDFSHSVQDGERISVYPLFESLDITPVLRLRPQPLRVSRFVLDTHLGRLARHLRLFGFDTLYRNDYEDAELAAIVQQQPRILLTRDQGLLKRRKVSHGYYVRATAPRVQLSEVFARFDLYRQAAPFSRCIACNGVLHDVAKAEIQHRLEPATCQHYEYFRQCSDCGRIYWQGSHYQRLQRLVHELRPPD